MNTFETDKKKEPPEKARSTVGDARGVTQTAAAAGGDSPLENFMAARRGADQPDAIMENWLAALDEFDHWKTNPTLFNSMELDPAWLNMKDVPLLAASAPATGTPADRDALSVPDTVFPLVRDLQMAIGYLEQSATGVWIDRLERQTGFWLAGRVRATISTVGAALAEAMTALCDSASLAGTDPGALSRQEESAGVTALAGDVLNLLGPADVIRLVDAGGGETGDLLAGDPDEKVLRARLTAVLAPQLRATVTSTPALQDNLAALTRLRVKDYYTARHGTLGESVDKLQRARAKSARLREAVSAHVNPGLDDRAFRLVKNLKTPGELSGVRRRAEMKALIAPLMRALEECEKTLGSAADRITVVRAGALNTLVRLFDEKVTDSTLVNHFRKKLTGIRRAVSKAAPYFAGPDRMVADLFQPRDPKSPLRGKMKAKKPGTLATLIDNLVQPGDPDSLLPAEKKSALSARIADRLQSGDPKPALPEDKKIPLMALMLPLEHAARQVKSLSGPLRSGAEKLERVLSREKATDVDPVRLMREGELNLALPRLKGPELAERVFGTVLEGALNRDQGAVRLDDKVQAARDSVDALTGPLITLLPHLIRQLSEEFRTRGEGLYAAFDGNKHVTALINHAGQQAALFKAALTTFQAATAAFRAETARGPKAAAALAAAAEEISLLAGQVISDVELYTSHLLGMKYGYGGHERKLVWGLKMLVLELGGDTPESARPILDRLTTLLRDPTRTFLRRKHDPENGLLTAALEQALYDHHNDISLKMKPTAAEMVAQAPGMMDALHSKAISKTLSAALSGGLDLPTDPLYQLLRAKNLLKVLPVYGSFKAMKKMGKSAMPGQLPPEYEQDKMLDKQAVNMMLTATTTVVPSIVLLPVAAPLAAHAALTKPALFVKKVAGRLPTDVGIAGVSGGVRGGLTAAQKIHKVLHKRTMEDRLRSLAGGEMGEEDLEELLAELAEGPANGSGQVRKDPSQGDKPLGRGKRSAGSSNGKTAKTQPFYTQSPAHVREWLNMANLGGDGARYALTRRGSSGTYVMYLGLEHLMTAFDPATDEVTSVLGGPDWTIDVLNRYLRRTQQDVDTERVKLNTEETERLYKKGYPVDLNMNERIYNIIQRNIDRLTNGGMINGVKITPDTLLEVTVWLIPPGGSFIVPVSAKFSIWEVATGQHIRSTPLGVRFKISYPVELESMFAEGVFDHTAYPYPITKMIDDDLQSVTAQLSTEESKSARIKLQQHMITASLAHILENEPKDSEAYRAIDDVLTGRKQVFTMKYYGGKMVGAIAIPLEGKDRFLVVNTSNVFTPGARLSMTVDMRAADNAEKSKEVFEWLKPCIPQSELAKHSEPIKGRSPERMGWEVTERLGGSGGIRRTKITLTDRHPGDAFPWLEPIPYSFHSTEYGTKGGKLAEKMAGDELALALEQYDRITYSPGEYYSTESIKLGQELLKYTPFAVMAIPSKIGVALAGLAAGVAGLALDLAEAHIEDDADARRRQIMTIVLLYGMLSVASDGQDADTLVKGLRNVRGLKARMKGYTQKGLRAFRPEAPQEAGSAGTLPSKATPAEATAPGQATRPRGVPPSAGRKAADAEYGRLQDEMKTQYGEAYSHLANRLPSRQGLKTVREGEVLKPNNMGVTSMADITNKIEYKGGGPSGPDRHFETLIDVGNRLEAAGALSPEDQLTHLAALEKSLSGTLFGRHRFKKITDGPAIYGNPSIFIMDPKRAAVLLDYLAEVRGRMKVLGGNNTPPFTDIKSLHGRVHHSSVEVEIPERPARIATQPARVSKSFAAMEQHEKIDYLTDYGMALPEAKALAAEVGEGAVRQSIRSSLQSKYTGHSKQTFTWGSEDFEKAHIERRLKSEGDRLKSVSSSLDNAMTANVPHRGPGNEEDVTNKAATWIVGSSQTLQARSDAEVAEAVAEMAKILDEFKNIDVTDFAQIKKLYTRLYRINPGEQARIFRTVEVPHFTSSFVGEAYFQKFLLKVKALDRPDLQGALIYEGLLRAHPFPDANGRTARALYAITEMQNKRFEVPKPVVIDGETAAAPRPGGAGKAPAVQEEGEPLQRRTGGRTKGPGSAAVQPVPVPPTGSHVIGNTVYVDGRPKANYETLDGNVIRISDTDGTVGSETAVFTAHGDYHNTDTVVPAPEGLQLSFLAPHDMFLADPGVPFILKNPDKYNAFVDINGKTYNVPKYKRPDLKKEATLSSYEDDFDPNTGLDIKVPVSLDNPTVATSFDTHGIGPQRPANPQAVPGEERKEIRNYNYWRYEHDDIGEIANAVQETAALSRSAGSPVMKQDVLMLDKRFLSHTHPLLNDTFNLEQLIKMHKEGKLVNSEGKPYKRLIMSHCRNNRTGQRYGMSDANLTYSLSQSEATDNVFTKGIRRIGAESYDFYEDTVEFNDDGSYTTTRRYVGTMYSSPSSQADAGNGVKTTPPSEPVERVTETRTQSTQSPKPFAGDGSGSSGASQVTDTSYILTPLVHPQKYHIYALKQSDSDQYSLYFWDASSRKLVPYGTAVERNGKWAKIQLEGGNLFGKGAKKEDEQKLNEYITDIRKDKNSLSEQERDEIGKNITELVDAGQNKGEAQSVKAYTHAGSDEVNDALRNGKRNKELNTFLSEFDDLNDYRGVSYRAAYVTKAGAKRLKNGIGKNFSDEGVQSASTIPVNANDWGADGFVTQMKTDDSVPVVFIFDEYVNQKNLSNSQLGDHVAVVPGTPLKLLATKEVDGVLYAYFTNPSKIPSKTYRLYDGVETKFM